MYRAICRRRDPAIAGRETHDMIFRAFSPAMPLARRSADRRAGSENGGGDDGGGGGGGGGSWFNYRACTRHSRVRRISARTRSDPKC